MAEKTTYDELVQRVRELEEALDRDGAETALQESEEKFQAIFEHSPLAIMCTDENGSITTANDNAVALFGAPREVLIGFSYEQIKDERMRTAIAEALAGDKGHFEGEYLTVTGNVLRQINANFSPSFAADGSVTGVIGIFEDITKRKQAEDELKASEERFRILTEATREGVCIHDQGVILDVNDAMATTFGYDRDELIGKKVLELTAPESRDLVKHNMLTDFEEPYEALGITKDGSILFGELYGKTIPYRDGTARVAAIRDLTEHKQAIAALKESEGYLQAVLDNTNQSIFLKDSDYKYIFINRKYERLAGVTNEEIRGRNDFDIFPGPVAALFRSQDEEVKKQNGLVEFTETIPLADGEHTFITSKFPLHDADGDIYAVGGVCTDITQIKQGEETLKESERKFKNIVEACPMGIFLYRLAEDDRLIFMDANQAASDILGVDCRQFIGKTHEESLSNFASTELSERFRLACREGTPWRSEQVDYQDSRIKGAYEINAFQTAPGMIAVLFRDITRRRQMEEEIQKIHKLESIGILAGGIAHDFNNLLTAIMGNISMAKMLAAGDEKIAERLVSAEKASLRAQDLTQQLLTFSKGGAPVRRAASIEVLIDDSISFTLSGSNVKCELEMADNLWPVMIDQGQISQVIQNIVKNAEQAMPKGGRVMIRAENITLEPRDLRSLPAGRYVRITIADQGTGIPKKYLANIFDPYFSTKQEGSGLGLAVAHSIIQKHDGLLTVKSEPGAGATFRIYLPASEEVPAEDKKEEKMSIMSGGRILVMDDEKTVLKVAGDMLKLMGYEAEVVRDGAEAVAMYKEAQGSGRPFDAVVLDLTIPGGMGGLETVRQLRKIDSKVKAIVSSGYANDPIMADFSRHGFSGVVAKPYTMQKFGETLKRVLDKLT